MIPCPCNEIYDYNFDYDFTQSGESWVTARARSGHEGDEQSVAGQAVCRTYSFQKGAGRQVPIECQVVRGGPEQPGER